MKRLLALFCLGLLAIPAWSADKKPAFKSIEKPARGDVKIEEEVRKYYEHLMEEDEDVKRLQERLTAKVRERAGGLFQFGDPHVVKWFPNAETRTSEDGDTERGPYLVFQTAGRWRTKDSESEIGLIAEFRVDFNVDTLKIDFLGFRQMTLTPISPKK